MTRYRIMSGKELMFETDEAYEAWNWLLERKGTDYLVYAGDYTFAGSMWLDWPGAMSSLNARVGVALTLIDEFGTTDGGHHKQWLIDQIARKLTGSPEAYEEWRQRFIEHEDNYDVDAWDEGMAP